MIPLKHGWIKRLVAFSIEGREIPFYISQSDEENGMDTLILAVFHGDEPESWILVSRFLGTFGPENFAGKQIGVVPIVNPDGFQRNQRVNGSAVDLNRNFPTFDWEEKDMGTPYYSGPKSASEPETRFILKILELFPPKKIISVHTPYRIINYDGPAKDLAEEMSKINGYPVVEDIGYSTPGSFGTYTGKERQIPTITLELPEEGFDEKEIKENLRTLEATILLI